jgi:ACR3 family arsenite efflux pump ArsB
MDKLRTFDFISVLLPGLVATMIIIYLWQGEAFFSKDGPIITLSILLIPVYLFVGHIISNLGQSLETLLDKIYLYFYPKKPKHPLVSIFDNYAFAYFKMTSLFPELESVSPDSKKYDHIFTKCKYLIYQQTYGERAQSISTLATFYRNLNALFSILSLVMLIMYYKDISIPFASSKHEGLAFIFICICISILSRILSQNLYRRWFHEVLTNTELYFKTQNFKKNDE